LHPSCLHALALLILEYRFKQNRKGIMSETRLNIRISPEKKDALYKKAEEEGKTVTDLLLLMIDQYLGLAPEKGELVSIKKRLQRLEEVVLGEIAA
jgi:hypothetical protein